MAAVTGTWGDVFDTTIIGIHQVLLADGRVLYWGGDGNGNAFSNTQKYGIYNPETGEHEILEASHIVRMFCGAGVIIPGTDQVLIGGGNGSGAANGQVFDLSDLSLTLDPSYELAGGRFYPTTVSLSTGQIVILGGNGGVRATPEIFTLGEGWRTLDGATDADLGNSWWYPRSWVNEDGNIIYIAVNAGNQNANIASAANLEVMLLDPSGDGSVEQIGSVPFDMDVASGSVMYDVGKIVMMDAYGDLWYMDINGDVPQFTFAFDFATDRNNGDMTVLPDGTILISGGTTTGNSQDINNAIFESVIFDPFTGTATTVDSEDVMRLYHSSTMLLADGTILSMGGGGLNGTLDFMDGQIFQPGYLFNDDGTLADRPKIISAPEDLVPGETFVIEVDDASAIARLSFVKTGAVTHSVNMEAGRMDLAFTVLSPTQIAVSLPENANVVGAGNWMLFAIDDAGVPSVAPIIMVQPTIPAHTGSNGTPDLLAEYFNIPSSTSTLDTIDFDAAPIETEFVDRISENGIFYPGGPADDFAARYTGDFDVSDTGAFTFFLTSDDGSRLYIDGQLVLDNDGLHGAIEEQVTLNLTAGSHTIEVRYFERGGGSVLDLDWSGPGFGREQMLFETALADEPNDTPATATDLGVVSLSSFEDLAISSTSDKDYFEFTAAETGSLTLSALFSHAAGDLDIQLFDASGNLLAASDSVSDNEAITFDAVVGTDYILLVEGYLGAINSYDLTFEPVTADRFEANDTLQTATGLGQVTTRVVNDLSISSGSDLDYFTFTAGQTGQLDLSVLFSHAAGDIDVQVLDANGGVLASADSVTDNEALSLNVVQGSTYALAVNGFAGATNDYALALAISASDSNDSFDTATELGTSSDIDVNGVSISSSTDVDFYEFTADQSGELTLSALFTHSFGDLDLELFDAAGNRIAVSETVTDNESIIFNVESGETYFARVFGYEGAMNDYELSLEIDNAALYEPNDTFATAANLGTLSNGITIGDLEINSGVDQDYFAFTASSTGQLDLSALFSHAAGDLDLALYDAAGNLLSISETLSDNESLTFDVTANTTYVARVFGYEGATNSYDLSLQISNAGNDFLIGSLSEGKDTYDGGIGLDTLAFETARDGLTIDLMAGEAHGAEIGFDRLISIEDIIGGNGADKLVGNNASNRIEGGRGFDRLQGNGGDDILTGGRGADTLIGGQGDDIISGGDGRDTILAGAGADAIDGGNGHDTLSFEGVDTGVKVNLATGRGYRGDAEGDTYLSIEDVLGSDHDDVFVTGADSARIFAGAGDDIIRAGSGGGDLRGGDGDDMLYASAGSATFRGGSGLDTVWYRYAAASVTVDRDDTALNSGNAAGDQYSLIERLGGGDYDDILRGSDTLNDRIFGDDGDDTIVGRAGDDRLMGDAGNDTLNGGNGFDRLFGGEGDDIMTGGSDRDNFYFEANNGNDTITDWQDGLDLIVFREGSGVTRFSDLSVEQQGADTLITYSGGSITLEATNAADFDAGDFGF